VGVLAQEGQVVPEAVVGGRDGYLSGYDNRLGVRLEPTTGAGRFRHTDHHLPDRAPNNPDEQSDDGRGRDRTVHPGVNARYPNARGPAQLRATTL
jgi:hypothetical protein